MNWLHDISWFFGGAFLANTIPHLVSGLMGRPFQTPFANPPGQGLSSSTLNVVWGFINLVIGYLLIVHVGSFARHVAEPVVAAGLGALVLSVLMAKRFGQFNGGNLRNSP
jgi:hypothetical protein